MSDDMEVSIEGIDEVCARLEELLANLSMAATTNRLTSVAKDGRRSAQRPDGVTPGFPLIGVGFTVALHSLGSTG
jgi:hypothetical protein